MKVLAAATCIAVLAAVGYYFWQEFRRTGSRRRADYGAAEPNSRALVDDLYGRYGQGLGMADDETILLSNCLFNKFVTQADLDWVTRKVNH